MGRKKTEEPHVRHVSMRLTMAEFRWLQDRANRLSQQNSVKVTLTAIARGLITRAAAAEKP